MSCKNWTDTEKLRMACERIKRRNLERITYFFFFCPHKAKKLFAVVKKVFGLCTLSVWSYSVMVITQDSESCDPGSSPGRTLVLYFFG